MAPGSVLMESAPPPAPAVIEIADGDLEVKAPAGDAVADGTPKDANTNGSKGQQSLLSFFGALKPPRSESGGPSREDKPTTNGEGDAGRARPRRACVGKPVDLFTIKRLGGGDEKLVKRKPKPANKPPQTKQLKPSKPRGGRRPGDAGRRDDAKAAEPFFGWLDIPIEEARAEDEAKQGLRDLWEFACVVDFFARFHEQLAFKENGISFDASALERALESDVHSSDFLLLVRIHVRLLQGMHPRSRDPPCDDNWVSYLEAKAKKRWEEIVAGPNPFEDAGYDYEALSPADRLVLLRLLCEIRLEYPDIRERLDNACTCTMYLSKKDKDSVAHLRPGEVAKFTIAKLNSREVKMAVPLPEVDDFRRELLGHDHYGRKYWLINLPMDLGLAWLCRQKRDRDGKEAVGAGGGANPKTRRGCHARPPMLPSWQVVCSSASELKAFIEDLDSSLFGLEMRKRFRNDVLPDIEEAFAQEDRRKKAEARLAAQGLGVSSDFMNEGRGRRKRKVVSYAEEDAQFDRMIEDAVRSQRKTKVAYSHAKRGAESTRQSGRLRSLKSVTMDWSDEEEKVAKEGAALAPEPAGADASLDESLEDDESEDADGVGDGEGVMDGGEGCGEGEGGGEPKRPARVILSMTSSEEETGAGGEATQGDTEGDEYLPTSLDDQVEPTAETPAEPATMDEPRSPSQGLSF